MDVTGLAFKIAEVILNPTITLMFAAALLFFVWGLVQYIQHADDPGKRKEGSMHMIWGLVGLFIMFSAVAILKAFSESIFG